jgi:hypothetical protein
MGAAKYIKSRLTAHWAAAILAIIDTKDEDREEYKHKPRSESRQLV